ncbi:hypothetical protein GYMLUDRAFT_164080 [Collybiopsis luxurians FD-317 M1]|uniref:Uncharacterized protein n=1 Tax=Collybiopsis luxurians FD-317 M1 TaxID=944289 RepID=A0A0D0C3I3_9AGAR|nr:hypothetical protein GYMLUDRAFT_164080 [Collybiopsis luxurians FD-317 M1]
MYSSLDEKIVDVNNPSIKCNFQHCCYPAAQFNLHNTTTAGHADYWNFFFSMCDIVNCSPFNWRQGGQFIAWSLGLVFNFPPGVALYVPSTCIIHGDIPIATGECHHSMEFFLPAGLV